MLNADQQTNKFNGQALIYSRTPATASMGDQRQKQEATRGTRLWGDKAGSKEGQASQQERSIDGNYQISRPAKR
jgi:hypothetical protein